jgi:hypothetical protein
MAEMGGENLPQVVAEVPWGHNTDLVREKVRGVSPALFAGCSPSRASGSLAAGDVQGFRRRRLFNA